MKTPKPKVLEEFCFGCMNCTIACPRGALAEPETGMLPVIKSKNCNGCRRCVDECPHNAIRISEEIVISSP